MLKREKHVMFLSKSSRQSDFDLKPNNETSHRKITYIVEAIQVEFFFSFLALSSPFKCELRFSLVTVIKS